MKAPKVTPQDFLIITNPEDMKSSNARLMAASYAARFRRRKRHRPINTQPGAALESFLLWRFGDLEVKQAKSSRQHEETISRQQMAEAERLARDIPTGLKPRISLQQYLEANPSLSFPVQVMLDSASASATLFFVTVDLKEVYYSLMALILTWLSTAYPSQYPISTGLFYHGKAIPSLRQRLAERLHDNETYISILCVMQTEAILGNTGAFAAHHKALKLLSENIGGGLNGYCKSVIPRHNFLAAQIQKSPDLTKSFRKAPPLHYLDFPYPPDVMELISAFPSGKQAIAHQNRAISLELMVAWRGHGAWYGKLMSSLNIRTEKQESNLTGPFVGLLRTLWTIIERVDPEESAFERFVCITQYITVMRLTYVGIVHKSPFFRSLQADASKFVLQFQPSTSAEFECFVSYSMYVINSWKTGTTLEEGGLRLVRSMIRRFPQIREWNSILVIVQKFLAMPPYMAEWKDNWLQGCSDK